MNNKEEIEIRPSWFAWTSYTFIFLVVITGQGLFNKVNELDLGDNTLKAFLFLLGCEFLLSAFVCTVALFDKRLRCRISDQGITFFESGKKIEILWKDLNVLSSGRRFSFVGYLVNVYGVNNENVYRLYLFLGKREMILENIKKFAPENHDLYITIKNFNSKKYK